MMARTKYGEQAACERCGQDIEFIGNRRWHDRGGNTHCPPYRVKGGEVIDPKGRYAHRPHRRRLAALMLALALTVAAPAFACEDGHWIKSVSRDGKVVILEDGSVWLIDFIDTIDTMLWLPITDIVACSDKLINTEDGETAGARRVR